jgi:choline dehydrogenase-like flavoprotein
MLGCRAHDHVDTDAGKMSGCRAFLGPLYGQEGIVVKGLDGFQVERVIIDKKTNRVEGARGWIDCTPTSEGGSDSSTRQRVLIKASLVVVSAGSFHSPALLLQSGIKVSGKTPSLPSSGVLTPHAEPTPRP